jgi:heme exporter protein B
MIGAVEPGAARATPCSAPLRSRVGFLRAAWIVAAGDLRLERRTGEASVAALLFGALVLVLAAFLWSGLGADKASAASAAYWVSVGLAAHLAVLRSWTRERDDGALDGLLLAPIPRAAILAGKSAAVAIILLGIEAVLAVPALLLFDAPVPATAGWVVAAIVPATAGIAVLGSLFGAMAAGRSSADLLVGVAVYPLLTPLFLGAAEITRSLLQGGGPAEVSGWFAILAGLDLVLGATAFRLFGHLVED